MRTAAVWVLLAAAALSCRQPAPAGNPAAAARSVPSGCDDQFQGARTFSQTHAGGVLAVAFLPDCRRALSSGVNDGARLWQLPTGRALQTFNDPRFTFTQVVFTRDGQRALSAGAGVRYWEVETGKAIREWSPPGNSTSSVVALSHHQRWAAAGVPGALFVWELATGTQVKRVSLRGQVLALAFSDDDQRLRAITDVGSCSADLQGPTDAACVDFPLQQMGPIVSASRPRAELLLGTRHGELFLWDDVHRTITQHWAAEPGTQEILTVELRPELNLALSLGTAAVRLWDVRARTPSGELKMAADEAYALALSDDARLALIGSQGGAVQLWKLPAR
jgi:hypothetical protein